MPETSTKGHGNTTHYHSKKISVACTLTMIVSNTTISATYLVQYNNNIKLRAASSSVSRGLKPMPVPVPLSACAPYSYSQLYMPNPPRYRYLRYNRKNNCSSRSLLMPVRLKIPPSAPPIQSSMPAGHPRLVPALPEVPEALNRKCTYLKATFIEGNLVLDESIVHSFCALRMSRPLILRWCHPRDGNIPVSGGQRSYMTSMRRPSCL